MIDLFFRTPWHTFYDVLAEGHPPMIARILALNTVFFILFMVRRAKGARALRERTAVMVQATLILANGLILFQDQVEYLLGKVI